MTTAQTDIIAEIVKIVASQPGCKILDEEISRRINSLVSEYRVNAEAERRRDKKVPKGEVKKRAATLRELFDKILSIIGPEVDPMQAEKPEMARLEDALIYQFDRQRGLTGDILRFMEWRDAARDIAEDRDSDTGTVSGNERAQEAATMIESVIFSRQGRPPLPPAAILHVGNFMDFWHQMTGAECNIWPEGRDSERAGKVKEAPAALFLQQCYRLIGLEKSLDAIRKDIRKYLDI